MKTNVSVISALCLLMSLTLSFEGSAQVKRGDYYFEVFEYGLALEAYEFAYNEQRIQNPHLSRKMALTHRMLGNMNESLKWYKKTLHRDASNAEDMLYYAEALKYAKDYKESYRWYKKYNSQVPNDRRAINHIEKRDYTYDLFRDSVFYDMKKLNMNSEMPEFGITRFNDKYLVSYTGVENPELGEKFFKGESESALYMDVYIFHRDAENELILEDWLAGGINSKYHDGPVVYDKNYEQMFITRNNVQKKKPVLDSKGKVNLKLYYSNLEGGVFQPAVELPFNSDEYSNAHPAVSPDGEILYFASNRDGGEGETDLYYCKRTNGGWGSPQNMGSVINTEGEESFPYIDRSGDMYFCSTGHAGLGGLDLFKSRMVNGAWTKPVNLGAPINSNKDDFGINLDPEGNSGYFSTNRDSDGVNDDIFYFHYNPFVTVRGNVQDIGNLAGIDHALVRIYDMDGNLIAEERSDAEGYFDLSLKPDKCKYRIEVSNGEGFSTENYMLDHCDKRMNYYDLGGVKIGEMKYLAVGTVREKYTGQTVAGFEVKLFNSDTGDEINLLTTEHDGRVEFVLSPETDYKMTFRKEDWFARSANFTTKGMEPGIVEIERYITMTFEQIVLDKPIEVENIYYDYNKYVVRADAEPELDKLVQMMVDNPTLTIELSSHTDARGSDKYNLALSDMRAKFAADYIVLKGIDRPRITGKGYGESALKNKCANGVDCSESEHERNRRTEFKVLKY